MSSLSALSLYATLFSFGGFSKSCKIDGGTTFISIEKAELYSYSAIILVHYAPQYVKLVSANIHV